MIAKLFLLVFIFTAKHEKLRFPRQVSGAELNTNRKKNPRQISLLKILNFINKDICQTTACLVWPYGRQNENPQFVELKFSGPN